MADYKMYGTGPVKVLEGGSKAEMTGEDYRKEIASHMAMKAAPADKSKQSASSPAPSHQVGKPDAPGMPKVAKQSISADGKTVKVTYDKGSASAKAQSSGKTMHGGKLSHGKKGK